MFGKNLIYIFGDTHLVREDTADAQAFLDLLHTVTQAPTTHAVWMLGDMLDACVGGHAGWEKTYPRFFDILRNSRAPILYLEGNRDFHMRRLFRALELPDHVVPIENDISLILDGHRVYVAHGDLVQQSDERYPVLRRWKNHWGLRTVIASIPFWAIRGATHLAASLLSKNHRTLSASVTHRLRTEFRTFAQQKWKNGYTDVVLGHSHIVDSFQENGRWYGNCGHWCKDRTYYVIDRNGWRIKTCRLQ